MAGSEHEEGIPDADAGAQGTDAFRNGDKPRREVKPLGPQRVWGLGDKSGLSEPKVKGQLDYKAGAGHGGVDLGVTYRDELSQLSGKIVLQDPRPE